MPNLDAHYRALPELSPYADNKRYELFKEDHKFFIKKIKERTSTNSSMSLHDAGCGNGELLYQIKKQFPNWKLSGSDFTPKFIETAKKFEGLKNVEFETRDLMDLKGQYDIVICTSVIQIFPDIEPPLKRLLSICKKDGFLFVDGLFNRFDVEVRLQYCDNSNPQAQGKWRVDWNQHSQASITRLIGKSVKSLEFVEVENNLDLPINPQMPINRFSFKDAKGRNLQTNATNLLLNKTLMIIQK